MPIPVHLHDFQAFSCTSCGRCCRPWAVSIQSVQTEAIHASTAYQKRARAGFLPLEVFQPGRARLGDRGDDHCTFLDPHNLCELHAEIGGRLKPLGCQIYPYQAVQCPDGIYVSLSFGCPPVVAGTDTAVQDNRQQLNEALGEAADPLIDSEEQPFLVDLSEQAAITWPSYLALEQRILEAYQPERPLHSMLAMSVAILRAQSQPGRGWPELNGPLDEAFAREILGMYVGSMVSAIENIEDEGERHALGQAISAGQTVYSPRFAMALPSLSLEEIQEPWIQDIYQRYFRNVVQGRALLKSTVLGKLLAVACAFVLVRYYAEAYRLARGRQEIDLDCLTDAFGIVEFIIVTHSPTTAGYFLGLEETFSKLSTLL
jgi:Fe-S-cluster containining protein